MIFTQDFLFGSLPNMRMKIALIIALGVMLSASVAASTFDLDVDDDGETTALTDGLLVIRYLFDFSGDALVAGAVSDDAARDTPDEIEAYLETNKIQLDVDGDGGSNRADRWPTDYPKLVWFCWRFFDRWRDRQRRESRRSRRSSALS